MAEANSPKSARPWDFMIMNEAEEMCKKGIQTGVLSPEPGVIEVIYDLYKESTYPSW
jgi:hypothetical protein